MSEPQPGRNADQQARSEERARRGAALLRAMTDTPFSHVRQDGDVIKIFFDGEESDHATLNVIDLPVDRVADPERLVRELIERHAPEMTGQRELRPFRPRGGFRRG